MKSHSLFSVSLCAVLLSSCAGAGLEGIPLEVEASHDGSAAAAIRADGGDELDRCVIEDGACMLLVPEGVASSVRIEGHNLVSCSVGVDEQSGARTDSVHVASGFLPAEPLSDLGWDNPERTGFPVFPEPVAVWGACGDAEPDDVGEVLLMGLGGILRVEGEVLTKDGGGQGWCSPDLTRFRLDSRDGGSVWFITDEDPSTSP